MVYPERMPEGCTSGRSISEISSARLADRKIPDRQRMVELNHFILVSIRNAVRKRIGYERGMYVVQSVFRLNGLT